MKKRLLFIFGTRPEAIKMAPLIKECQRNSQYFETSICTTGQHKEMLDQVLQFFEIKPDFELAVMRHNQTLFDTTAAILTALSGILTENDFDIILVQGDTTTAMIGALAGYYKKINVAHVEAGLRSGDIYAPFPEEVNRKIISTMAHYHFAPTETAKQNLNREQYSGNVFVTGNTVIDALLWGVEKVRTDLKIAKKYAYLKNDERFILVTAHRRESFGKPFENICNSLLTLVQENSSLNIVYPVHLNPNVQEIVQRTLKNQPNIYLIEPATYPELLWLIDHCFFVITDSGGIQEEAPALGKPVLVIRDVTERQEGIDAGTAQLVGTSKEVILAAASALLHNPIAYDHMAKAVNPYGDGTASKKIVSILLNSA